MSVAFGLCAISDTTRAYAGACPDSPKSIRSTRTLYMLLQSHLQAGDSSRGGEGEQGYLALEGTVDGSALRTVRGCS